MGTCHRVKFISYTGEYPNLCSGVLTLEIDGKEYKFGHNYNAGHYDEKTNKWIYTDEDLNNPNFTSFWYSGGYIDNLNIGKGEWNVNIEEVPEQFYDVVDEIEEVINDNIPYGCCGGCI